MLYFWRVPVVQDARNQLDPTLLTSEPHVIAAQLDTIIIATAVKPIATIFLRGHINSLNAHAKDTFCLLIWLKSLKLI